MLYKQKPLARLYFDSDFGMNIMNLQFCLLLIPCVVIAEIVVEVLPADDNPKIVIKGSENGNATDADANTFQLTNAAVKQNLKRLGWSVGDVNIMHASVKGYRDLNIILKATKARIQRKNERTMKFYDSIEKRIEKEPQKIYLKLNRDVVATLRTKWYDNKDVSIGHIRHVLGFKRLEHVSVYGQEDFATIDIPIEAETDVVFQPGQRVIPHLEVKETTLEVRVDYELSLDGDIYFEHYCIPKVEYCFKGSKMDVTEYFKRLNYSPVLESYEIATFTYCHDPKVVAETKDRRSEGQFS